MEPLLKYCGLETDTCFGEGAIRRQASGIRKQPVEAVAAEFRTSTDTCYGEVAERSNAPVLKTGRGL